MTNLQDLERRLRSSATQTIREDVVAMTEAADLIATLRQMGEGLPEPALPTHIKGPCYTREQMIQYGQQQREKALDALQFYADKKNWSSPSTGFALQYDPVPAPVQSDRGEKARDALKGKQ